VLRSDPLSTPFGVRACAAFSSLGRLNQRRQLYTFLFELPVTTGVAKPKGRLEIYTATPVSK